MPFQNLLNIQSAEFFIASTNLNLQPPPPIKLGSPAFALNGLSGYVFIDKAALFSPEYLTYRIPVPRPVTLTMQRQTNKTHLKLADGLVSLFIFQGQIRS